VSATKRASSESRNDSHLMFSGFDLSKIFAMSRGSGICVKLSMPNIFGATPEMNGACDAAATSEMLVSSATSCGPLSNW